MFLSPRHVHYFWSSVPISFPLTPVWIWLARRWVWLNGPSFLTVSFLLRNFVSVVVSSLLPKRFRKFISCFYWCFFILTILNFQNVFSLWRNYFNGILFGVIYDVSSSSLRLLIKLFLHVLAYVLCVCHLPCDVGFARNVTDDSLLAFHMKEWVTQKLKNLIFCYFLLY